MKNYRATIIVVTVFFALFAFVYFFESKRENKQDKVEQVNEVKEEQIVTLSGSEVNKVSIEYNNSKFTLEKKDDQWKMAEDPSLDVNDLKIKTILDDFKDLKTKSKFKFEKIEDYGLNNPAIKIAFELKDGKKVNFDFGNKTLDETNVYVRKDGNDEIFTLPVEISTKLEVNKDSFKKEVEEKKTE